MQISLVFDPTNNYQEIPQHRLVLALGILPHWALEAVAHKEDVRIGMEQRYGFPLYAFAEGEGHVDTNLCYHYPGDPVLHPLAVLTHPDGKVVFYEHSLVAFLDNDENLTTFTRMD